MKKLALGLLKSADEKLKSLSKGQGPKANNQVSPAAEDFAPKTPERFGRRETANRETQSKSRHRSRSEGPNRGERQRIFDKNDSQGPQWAVSHEPRRSPRPLCLRQFSDDDIPEVIHSGSDTDSGDSGPKRWTRNPLLIKKTKKVEKGRMTDWKKPVSVINDNKSQTMPTSIGRNDFDSQLANRQAQQMIVPNTWSNPDRVCSASPKGKFQRLEEMRQQRMEVCPTSDEEGNPHLEISNQIRQRLSQVQAGRGRGRKSSLGEYEGIENRVGTEYTNYLKNAGDQIILEPKLKSELPKQTPMTASFPSYRPISTAFTSGSGSLSPTVTSKRDSVAANQPEKPAKPRMVVVEYPRKNQPNGGISNSFKLDPKYDSSSTGCIENVQSELKNQASHNLNRNSTAIAFGNNIQCIIPSHQQEQYQAQPPVLPPRQQQAVKAPPDSLLYSQSPSLQHHFRTQQELQAPHPLLQPCLSPQKQEPLITQQQQHPFWIQPMPQQLPFLQQQDQQQKPQIQSNQPEKHLPLRSQMLDIFENSDQSNKISFIQQQENTETNQFSSLPNQTSSYHPVNFQPLPPSTNGSEFCLPSSLEFKIPEMIDSKAERSKNLTPQKKHHSKAGPISVSTNNGDGGILLHVPARHISKSYSDGDSLDELLESNMPYLESSSEINTLQLHRHSMKVIEDGVNGTTTTTTITDTICVTSQPATPTNQLPDIHSSPALISPDIQPQLTTSPLPQTVPVSRAHILPASSMPGAPSSQMLLPKVTMPDLVSAKPETKSPLVSTFISSPTTAASFDKERKPDAARQSVQPFKASEMSFADYKPIIKISESLLVSESNKTTKSIGTKEKSPDRNCKTISSPPPVVPNENLNSSPPPPSQPGLSVPIKDTGMFSDVEYDIEVSERVKKWEKYMKTPIKNPLIEIKACDMAGDNHLATTVKDMASEWSKYLSVIEEDNATTKSFTTETPKSVAKMSVLNAPRKNSLETQRKITLLPKSPAQTGSISDSDMYKNKSPYVSSLGQTKSLLQVSPLQDMSSSIFSHSYHEGTPNKSPSLDSPLFIPSQNLSNDGRVSDIVVPARSPIAIKTDSEFLVPPQTRSPLLLSNAESNKTIGSSFDPPTQDLFDIAKMAENRSRRKSDSQAMPRTTSQLSPRNMAITEQCSWKNLIGDMQEKLKDTEIWSPEMDSHQGPVSIERVTARTLETIPFSEDPFWKEIEELTNFDQLTKDLPSDSKSPPPPATRSRIFPSVESTTNSCYQVSMISSQPSNNQSQLSSLLSSLTDTNIPTKSYSTSNLKKTTFKSDGMNALDEVLLDLEPVLGKKLTTSNQNKQYNSSTDMSNTTSPRRPISYHSTNYVAKRTDHQNPQGFKSMFGSATEEKDSSMFSSIANLQETHSNMTYQSMTNLGEKQYENVVNGNYQLDPSVLKEKLMSTGLVERSSSHEDFALLKKKTKNTNNNNIFIAVNEAQKPMIQPQPEENIEELKILAQQVEDKLSEIKTKILKADDTNLDKIINTLKTFSPSTSAMLSANIQTPKVASRDSFIARKAKLNDAIVELEKIYDKLNLGNEVYLEHAKSMELPSFKINQERHLGFRLSSSFSQLYESSQSYQSKSDTFHSDIHFLSDQGNNNNNINNNNSNNNNSHYGELTQVPVKDVGSKYPIKISSSSLTTEPKMEDASEDSLVSNQNEVPTRRSRTRRQRRAAMANESNQESRKSRYSVNYKDEDYDAPRAYITSVTVERSPRSKSSVRSDGLDGGSRQANGSRRPKPPPRSSSLHRKAGRDEERSRRKSTPPDFDLKQGSSNDAVSQSSNSPREPLKEGRQIPRMMYELQQQQRQELSCSSDSSAAESIHQKKRAVSKSIAKMVDLFSSSDEERYKKTRSRPKAEPPMSEIGEDITDKVSDDWSSSKSSPKSQPTHKVMTPRSVKQRHEAKRQKAAAAIAVAVAQQMSNDACSALMSDDTPATEDSLAASKPPLPLRRQRSQSSEKCVSSSEDNTTEEGGKSERQESSQSEPNPREKTPSSNTSRNRWSISSAHELLNTSNSSVSSEQGSSSTPGKVLIDRTERCRSFHELFASFEPDQKRIEKLKRLQKSASEEASPEENSIRTFRSEPDLRDGWKQVKEPISLSQFQFSITVNQ